jgi:hypothetical protein
MAASTTYQPKRRRCKYEIYLGALSVAVSEFIKAIDAEMKAPASNERGIRIAGLVNSLNIANDRARIFALGESFHKPGESCDGLSQ